MAAVKLARNAAANVQEPVKAPRAVVADDQALVLEKVLGMRAVGPALLDGSLAETEAMASQDDTSSHL